MNIVTKTATQARNEFFDLIAAAKYGGQVVLVTLHGKVAALITPVDDTKIDWTQVNRVVDKLKVGE